MPTMKSVRTAAPGTIEVAEIQRPAPGPRDVLLRVRACGICGTGAAFVQTGGMPPGPEGETAAIPLGHEPAGEVVEIGAEVTGLKTGDWVVVNPQAAPSGIIGCSGALGGMSEYLLIENAVAGKSIAVFPAPCPSRSPRSMSRWRSPGTASTGPEPAPPTRWSCSAPGPSGSGR
jgi:(R,R)-butanediol dehydrogenase / meso-butanediol dehydrogenase / diacetyl reductase